MTDTTKQPMTLERVRDWHRRQARACAGHYRLQDEGAAHDEMADALDAQLIAQREGDKADALRDSAYIAGAKEGYNLGVEEDNAGLQKIIQSRKGYLKSLRKHRQNEVKAINAQLTAQREGEAVAYVPIHPKIGPLWANATATPNSENVPQHYPLMALYVTPPQPLAAVTITAETFERARNAYHRETRIWPRISGLRAAIEAVLKGK